MHKAVLLALAISTAAAGPPSKRMPDGKQWMTENLGVETPGSSCYDDAAVNCRQYGRLYTWEAAQAACRSLGEGWRLPTNDEWRALATHFGGLREETADLGKAAYQALYLGGASGFNVVLGGGREPDGRSFARLDAHGFYWTSSETSATTAWLYNFGKGQLSVNRHRDTEKTRAVSVRCIRY